MYRDNRGLIKLLILTPLTLGIYIMVFWYKYARDVNLMCDGDGKHTSNYFVMLLLAPITLGIYALVWEKKMQDRLRTKGNEWGCNITHTGMSVIAWKTLGVLLFAIGPIVGLYFQIQTINQVAIALNRSPSPQRSGSIAPAPISPVSPITAPKQDASNMITCPICHCVQKAGRGVCFRCGNSLIDVPVPQEPTDFRPATPVPIGTPPIRKYTQHPVNQPMMNPSSGPALLDAPHPRQTPPAGATGSGAITCPRCHATLAQGAAFCIQCGLPLQRQPDRPALSDRQDGAAAVTQNNSAAGGQHDRIANRQPVRAAAFAITPDAQAQTSHTSPEATQTEANLRRRRASASREQQAEGVGQGTEAPILTVDRPAMAGVMKQSGQPFNSQSANAVHRPAVAADTEGDIAARQDSFSKLFQRLPEPKPIYLWVAMAAACLFSLAALLVSIFR